MGFVIVNKKLVSLRLNSLFPVDEGDSVTWLVYSPTVFVGDLVGVVV